MSIKIYVKYVKNNRDFHTTKLNLPTGNLDSREAQEVIGLLKMTCREFNQTVVLVTHEKEIADMADQVIFLKDGKIADMERRQKNYVRKKICNDKKTGKSEYYRT